MVYLPIKSVNDKQRKLAAVKNWNFYQLEKTEVFSIKIWQLWQAIAKYTKLMCYTTNIYIDSEQNANIPTSVSHHFHAREFDSNFLCFPASLYCPTTSFLLGIVKHSFFTTEKTGRENGASSGKSIERKDDWMDVDRV